jgi:hypothetical protein
MHNYYFEGFVSGIMFMMILYLINLMARHYLLTKNNPPNWINWEDEDF